MKTRKHIKPATVGLGLLAALAATGLLVNCKSRSTGPVPSGPVQTTVGTIESEQIHRKPAAAQSNEVTPDLPKSEEPEAETSGYEMPFADTNQVPKNLTMDLVKLRAELTAAADAGNVRGIAEFLNSGDSASEVEAVRLLARMGEGEALAAALGKLLTVPEDSSDYNRFVQAFADCRSAAVAEWLTGFLGETETDDIRQRVRSILASLRGPEVIGSLAVNMVNPKDAMHAKDCAELLASVTDPEQAAVLRALLETGKSAEIKIAAARGLASVGSGAACAALVETGSSTEAAAAACREALATVDSSYAQETLIQAAGDPSVPSDVRYAAVQALSAQSGQRPRTVLVNLGQTTDDPALKAAIQVALQKTDQSGTPPQSGETAGSAGIGGELWF